MNKKRLDLEIENYHPDMEIKGSGNVDYGHTLAERLEKSQKNYNQSFEFIGEGKKKVISEILKYSPKQLRVTKNQRTKLKGELSRLKKSGYDIDIEGNLKNISTEKMWNVYVSVLKNNNYFN